MTFDFTGLFEIVISILATIASCFIIPLIKEKLDAEKLERLVKWVKIAVEAAEQIYGSGTGQEKREYVVNFLLAKGIVFDVDKIETIIESAVFQLPKWLETQFELNDAEEATISESEVE
jgi:hypothetical protein